MMLSVSRHWLRLTPLAAALLLAACDKSPVSTDAAIDTDQQKFSYAVGVEIGRSLTAIGDDVDHAALQRGLTEALADTKLAMSDEDMEKIKASTLQTLQAKRMKEMQAKAGTASDSGRKFLEDNGRKPGVITTPSGLQYEVLKAATGERPRTTDTVTVHYHGTLINGEVFDSSVERGQPASFPLDRVIPGWTEGVQLMTVGSKYKFTIPSNLAYGEQGSGGKIGPNETLVFEVELLGIEK